MVLRKYGSALVAGVAGSDLIRVSLRKAGLGTYATSADWTPAAGDCLVSKDGAAEANIAALPSYANGAWNFALSAAEMTAKMVRIRISDAALDDFDLTIESFGSTSGTWPGDFVSPTLDSKGAETIAAYVDTEVAAIKTDTAAILTAVDTEVAAIKTDTVAILAKTNLIPADPLEAGDVPTAAAIADAVWDEALTGHVTVGTTGRALQLARAQAKGKWQITGDNLALYDVDNTTLLATFAIAPPGGPFTSRTAVAE